MSAKLIVEGKEFNIGVRLLGDIASNIPDEPHYSALMDHLALTQTENVRCTMARQDNISVETLRALLKDKSMEVLTAAVTNSKARKELTTDELISLINYGHKDLIENICGSIGDYENSDPVVVAEHIMSLQNKLYLLYLADSYTAPKQILKKLSKHEDPDIKASAISRLS
jgi:hypothetical protein